MHRNRFLISTIISFLLFLGVGSAFGIIPKEERDALIALYDSTEGHNWEFNENWLGSHGTEDSWYGITVTGDHVTSIDLRWNNLSGTIPPEIGGLIYLQQLHLGGNQLMGTIPTEIGNLTNLEELVLANNQLTFIPPEIGNLTNLQYLYLSDNQLTGSIPAELGSLTNLQYLDLLDNQLTGLIPLELSYLINLIDLNLGWNQLTGTIPLEIGGLTYLQNLYLDGNQLTGTIPSELGNLINLEYLDLDRNQLTGTIPSELGNLTNLQYLNLDRNQLTGTIPPELGNLTSLQYLRIGSNQLTAISPELGNLTNLESLYLPSNQITDIPPELGNLINLQYLSLWHNQITAIPPELGNLTNLIFLSLSSNEIRAIPPELGNLTNLQSLYLGGNQITAIPPELGSMTMLQDLYLSHNQLTGSIPLELCQPNNLEYLDLSENQLTGSIPPELCNISKLRDLSLWSNQFTGSIPSALGILENLQYLNLSDNQLTGAIPPALGNLANLYCLSLGGNQLSGSIPAEIVNLTSLNDNGSEFRWNALYTDVDSIRDFVNLKQSGGDWESTQTVAPTELSATPLSGGSIKISWTPIQYTSNEGGYRIFKSTASGGHWEDAGMTESKNAFEFDVTGLYFGTTYYFVVQTQTNPHSDNRNTVLSEYSEEVSATTLQHYVLTITSRTGGTTNPAPGTHAYNPGAGVSIEAIPDSGYQFSSWGGDASGTSNPITLIMDSDKSVAAHFMKISEETGLCFIATAAYSSPLHPHLDILRDFRDKYLITNKLGRTLINLYYKYSPSIANTIAENKPLKVFVRINLIPFIIISYAMLHLGLTINIVTFFCIVVFSAFTILFFQRR